MFRAQGTILDSYKILRGIITTNRNPWIDEAVGACESKLGWRA